MCKKHGINFYYIYLYIPNFLIPILISGILLFYDSIFPPNNVVIPVNIQVVDSNLYQGSIDIVPIDNKYVNIRNESVYVSDVRLEEK